MTNLFKNSDYSIGKNNLAVKVLCNVLVSITEFITKAAHHA